MEKKNFQLVTDEIISALPKDRRPLLLLHTCCAPCGSYVLKYLSEYFDIDVLYYNPNIFPSEEYAKRLSELEKLCALGNFSGRVQLIEIGYYPERFDEAAKGLENEPEGGARCEKCFRLRLTEAALEAKKRNADRFSTTLSVSPHKNSALLNQIGGELEKEYNIRYLYSDFKKRGGYKKSIELSKKYGLYRQDYCGCEFSIKRKKK
ncbi:MAG: epoxyqueuosine reductase QueH [Acutalibacteraceae bacterium]|jgi:predicted adenine nucleotide alpha hydrolase (AANH) superfamily ATPase